jgi:hypothetical protein
MTTYLLIHSPLVSPLTWSLVADALHRQGHQALVPSLFGTPNASLPYWRQHVAAVAAVSLGQSPILVAHSGAGPLLPAIAEALRQPVAGYVFADTDLPRDNASRFDLFESVEDVEAFREEAVDGMIPPWTADDLRGSIPDDVVREHFAADLRPVPLAVYEEPLPVFAAFPDAPCGYLHFSKSYDNAASEAQARGWLYKHMDGGHFLPLVAPGQVAAALMDFAAQVGA